MSEIERVPPRSRKILKWVIIVSVPAIALSIELTRVYYNSWSDIGFEPLCSISERVDCVSFALSGYSRILGLPASLFAVAFHVLAIILVALQLTSRRPVFRHSRNYLFILSAAVFLYSFYPAFVSLFILKNLCIYSAALYLLNVIVFILVLFSLDPAREFLSEFSRDGQALLKDGLVFGLCIGFAAVIITALVYHSWRLELSMQEKIEIRLGGKKYDLELFGDPVLGPACAPVTMVEFTDYECYQCARLHMVIMQVIQKYGPRVRLIFKTFPIYKDCNQYLGVNAHPHACEAAYATECAFRSGVFEEYVEKLFRAQSLEWDDLLDMAGELGLSRGEFETCMKSDAVWEAVQKDVEDASVLNLKSAPVFFVNGREFKGYRSLEEMSSIIDFFLKGAGD